MRVPSAGEEFGRYRLDRVLGRGGMGIVFAATDPRLNRTVALKVITGALANSPEFRSRFQAEAESLARLESPNVITIYDHDEIDETPFIVTQYVDGVDLGAWLREHGQMPARQALTLCAQMAGGLYAAHRAGVVHRDVKPGNVLVRDIDKPAIHGYLCDFGIARIDGAPGETAAGAITGTWTYMAPERVDNQPASPASDIYSLGCVLWACLTGSDPYAGTEVQVAVAHQQAPVPQLPGTSEFVARLNGVLATALAKDPTARYPDADAFRQALEALVPLAPGNTMERPGLADEGTAVRPAPPVGPAAAAGAVPPPPPPAPGGPPAYGGAPLTAPSKRRRSRAGLFVGIGIVVLALIVGGIAWALLRDDDNGKGDTTVATVEGDVSGDKYGDAVVWHWDPVDRDQLKSVYALPSNGSAFGAPVRDVAQPGAPVLGDVDGDGIDDVVFVEEDDDRLLVSVEPAKGEGWTYQQDLDPTFNIYAGWARLADLDGDGRDDLVLVGSPDDAPRTIHVALAARDGFGPLTRWYQSKWGSTGAEGYTPIWAGDFDGDGTDEIVHFSASDPQAKVGHLEVLKADGDKLVQASARKMTDIFITPLFADWIAGDADGDGVDELVVLEIIRLGPGDYVTDGARSYVYNFEDLVMQSRGKRWRYLSDQEVRVDPDAEDARTQPGEFLNAMLSDVDGDDDADIVTLRETDEADDAQHRLMLYVLRSSGSSFGEPERWAELPCPEGCAGAFQLIE